MTFKNISLVTLLLTNIFSLSFAAQATVVQFKTSQGDFEVNLFDNTTPKTVANFLTYVEESAYNESFIHRSKPNFIIQGGGHNYSTDDQALDLVIQHGSVVNEPVLANVRGTIAMAKLGSNENSATNQWFFNLNDNTANLDDQNGGFTVFGIVMGDGMEVIDRISAYKTYNLGGVFTETPLEATPQEGEYITDRHLIMIESIDVTDTNIDTNLELLPKANTSESTSSGSMSWIILLTLFSSRLIRRN